MKKGIIFDLDGTLWDSAEGVVNSWNEVIMQLPTQEKLVTIEDMYSLMGKPMDEIGRLVFPNMEKKTREKVMQKCCDQENEYLRVYGGVLFPELEKTLVELNKNYELFIVSNCQCGYIEAFLEYYQFEKYFKDTECFGQTGLQKADNIKLVVKRNRLDQAIYVGDTYGDYTATKEAGLPFVLADYGFGEVPDAIYHIDTFASLLKLVPEIFENEN